MDGDALVYSIACASVVAKTVRDRMMGRLAVRYPQYGWERNQGYATQEHRDAIRAHGLTPHHRRSFQALQVLLAGDQLGLFDGVPVMDEVPDERRLADEADGSRCWPTRWPPRPERRAPGRPIRHGGAAGARWRTMAGICGAVRHRRAARGGPTHMSEPKRTRLVFLGFPDEARRRRPSSR